jgi:uncharacterized membrane protein
MAAGAVLLYAAARQPRNRTLLRTAGASLLLRGVSGFCPVNALVGRGRGDTKEALGGPRGVHVRDAIVIARPAAAVFAYWRDLRNLPHFMRHLDRVDVLDERRSHWVAHGPAGTTVEWDAEIINEREPELIGWKSIGSPDVVSAGSVHFRPLDASRTEISLHLQYSPPAGHLGAWLAGLLGADPAQQIREDLSRLKAALESGESTATPDGTWSGARDAGGSMVSPAGL